jgi:GTP cyclohydrolase II
VRVPHLQDLVTRDKDHDCAGFGEHHICVRVDAVAHLPTRFGEFAIVVFSNNQDGKEHVALVHGNPMGRSAVPTRMHSECLTGDIMGSLRCDCRDQLEASLKELALGPYGVLLYLRQEGRGIGLTNKIRAYALQEHGLDTVEANLALGFRDDERDYAVAAHMIKSLNLESVELLTNNPKKIAGLTQYGIEVSGRVPLVMPANDHNRFYLQTKARKSGHAIELEDVRQLPDQNEPVAE